MKAFILAAGFGTRLQPLTNKKPKVMVEVGGQKILERTICQLKKAGVDDLIINTHYFPEVVTNYFGNGSKFGVKIQYSFEMEILGTAGGLKKQEKYFKNEKEFLVIYGDNIFDLEFKKIINQPFNNSCCIVMLFDRTKNAHSGIAGGVVLVDSNGMISGFYEGVNCPDIPYVNAGVYKCTPEVLSYIPENQFYDFGKQLFPKLFEKHIPLQSFIIDSDQAVFGVDTHESLNKTNNYLNSKKKI
jgi:NDP-sugar pyrophosphorylase family protein